MLSVVSGTLGFVSKFPGFLGWSMLPECSDYAEWKFGQRADGLMSSSLTFINKFGMAIGGFFASYLLGVVGYTPDVEQSEAVINMIVILKYGFPILGYIASLISMSLYEINDEKFKEIRADLAERKATTNQ